MCAVTAWCHFADETVVADVDRMFNRFVHKFQSTFQSIFNRFPHKIQSKIHRWNHATCRNLYDKCKIQSKIDFAEKSIDLLKKINRGALGFRLRTRLAADNRLPRCGEATQAQTPFTPEPKTLYQKTPTLQTPTLQNHPKPLEKGEKRGKQQPKITINNTL